MSRRPFTILDEAIRQRAMDFLRTLPLGYRVLFHEPKRSTIQNDKMWAMLADLAKQVEWHGQMLEDEDWKVLMMDALNREVRMVPAINGRGWTALGRSTSKLSKREMADLITLIQAFGDERGVVFGDEIITKEAA